MHHPQTHTHTNNTPTHTQARTHAARGAVWRYQPGRSSLPLAASCWPARSCIELDGCSAACLDSVLESAGGAAAPGGRRVSAASRPQLHMVIAAPCCERLKEAVEMKMIKRPEERPEQHKQAPVNPRTLKKAACFVGQDKMAFPVRCAPSSRKLLARRLLLRARACCMPHML